MACRTDKVAAHGGQEIAARHGAVIAGGDAEEFRRPGSGPGAACTARKLGSARASAAAVTVARLRDTHPLAPALPVIRRLVVDDAIDSGAVVAVSAADGTLLWVEGDSTVRRKAEAMNFLSGADWSERVAGTNAPGTALALDRELQIRGGEHFSRIVQPWSCTAAPPSRHRPDRPARRHPHGSQPPPRRSQRRPPRRAARRQGPRRRDGACRDVAAAQGDRTRTPEHRARTGCWCRSRRMSGRSSTRSTPVMSNRRWPVTRDRCCRSAAVDHLARAQAGGHLAGIDYELS